MQTLRLTAQVYCIAFIWPVYRYALFIPEHHRLTVFLCSVKQTLDFYKGWMGLTARQQLCRKLRNGINFTLYTDCHAYTLCIQLYKGGEFSAMIPFLSIAFSIHSGQRIEHRSENTNSLPLLYGLLPATFLLIGQLEQHPISSSVRYSTCYRNWHRPNERRREQMERTAGD